jgi:hypothetical protein
VADLGHRAEFNGFALAQLVSLLPSDTPVSLVGHSHGARTVAAALHLLAGGHIRNRHLARVGRTRTVDSAVLMAAAIDSQWLQPWNQYGLAPCSTRRLVNLVNRNDSVLAIYPLRKPLGLPAAGTVGVPESPWPHVCNCDVTSLIGRGHFQRHYLQHPEIAALIADFPPRDNSQAPPELRSGESGEREPRRR